MVLPEGVEDFLENDKPIPGQKYGCISFVSPDNMIEKRELFYMSEFFKKYCEEEGMDKDKALNFLKKYEDFKFGNGETLLNQFNDDNDGACCIQGFKVRGVYGSYKEAKVRGEVLRKQDPNFNAFVFQVGYWCPWSPQTHEIEDENYAEAQLNDLVNNYKINKKQRDEFFATEQRERGNKTEKDEGFGITIGDDKDKQKKITELGEETNEEETVPVVEANLNQNDTVHEKNLNQNDTFDSGVEKEVKQELFGNNIPTSSFKG
jgi:hypothetical protein